MVIFLDTVVVASDSKPRKSSKRQEKSDIARNIKREKKEQMQSTWKCGGGEGGDCGMGVRR